MLIGASFVVRRGHLLMRGWSHSPTVREGGDVTSEFCFLVWCPVGVAPVVSGVRLCKIEMLFTYARCTSYSLGYSRDMQGDICEIYMYDVCSGYEEFAAAVAARCCSLRAAAAARCCSCCSLLLLLLLLACCSRCCCCCRCCNRSFPSSLSARVGGVVQS